MPCFSPLQGWYSKKTTPNGKRQIVFTISAALTDRPATVPCGQCSGCRLERSRMWAIRCHHEASLYENNVFVTLTYNDKHLPTDMSVDVKELQGFMKRLRKHYSGQKIRFYGCGEYGDQYGRPHYHALLFNHEFTDKEPWKKLKENMLWRSPILEKIWPYGHSSIGTVNFKSAGYVARYIMKKINGDPASEHYAYTDQYGEIHQRKPEFTNMSRKPGIGADWLQKYKMDVYPEDFIVIEGKKMRPPRYYDTAYEITDPEIHRKIKWTRQKNLRQHADNNTPARLRVRQQILDKKLGMLPRTHDRKE